MEHNIKQMLIAVFERVFSLKQICEARPKSKPKSAADFSVWGFSTKLNDRSVRYV